jgi:hypothetical protein
VPIQENRGASRKRRALFYVWGLTSFAAIAGERIYFNENDRDGHELAAYSRAVRVLPMTAQGRNQVRVWIRGYWSGRMPIRGYIVDVDGVSRCTLSYNNDNGKYLVINRGHCSPPRTDPERIAKILASLRELATFDVIRASCGVMDGWGAKIEGVVEGEHFQFSASNPDACENAKPVNDILKLIEDAYDGNEPEVAPKAGSH